MKTVKFGKKLRLNKTALRNLSAKGQHTTKMVDCTPTHWCSWVIVSCD